MVRDDLQQVEREISLESIASVDAITAIGRYLQDGGGKRLRPMLVLLSAKMVGEATGDVISLAAVVELLHTATLAHDDVIDVAETRRGRPSPNVIWATTQSVLAATGSTCKPSRWRCGSATSHSRPADRPHAAHGGGRTAAARSDW
jgi:octaprenyl-diphosphate synthase